MFNPQPERRPKPKKKKPIPEVSKKRKPLNEQLLRSFVIFGLR